MSVEETVGEAHRREWGRVLAAVVRTTRDFDVAEDATQEAFVAAMEAWRRDGVPDNPGAWLTTTARRKAVDRLRREATLLRKLPLLIVPEEAGEADDAEEAIPDERLRLIFTCCHTALSAEARIALTLRLVCGLATPEIARLFLVSESTMAARLTRAKKKIRTAGIPYRTPAQADLPVRLPAVLTVVYLLLTEGHTASRGPDLMRPALAVQAIDLARMLAALMPREPEVLGLLALGLITDSRRNARTDAAGGLVQLADQDRALWDRSLIEEGTELVERALRLSRGKAGQYALQAAIAAVHAEAVSYEKTDWRQILVLQDLLLAVHPSPVVALGRAVSIGMVHGPEVALREIASLADDSRLASYHLLRAVRGDLLRRLGDKGEAADEYAFAAHLTDNGAERDFLRRRSIEMMEI